MLCKSLHFKDSAIKTTKLVKNYCRYYKIIKQIHLVFEYKTQTTKPNSDLFLTVISNLPNHINLKQTYKPQLLSM